MLSCMVGGSLGHNSVLVHHRTFNRENPVSNPLVSKLEQFHSLHDVSNQAAVNEYLPAINSGGYVNK